MIVVHLCVRVPGGNDYLPKTVIGQMGNVEFNSK